VRGCWRSYPLGGWAHRSADGIASSSRSEASSIELLRAESACRETVVVMGCALALGLLCDRLNAERGGGRFSWFSTSSGEALRALAEGRSHLAGVHLIDERSGEANVPDVRRQTRGQSVVLVTLGNWEAGLVVARGNPHGIRSGEQLGRRGLRLVVREPGSGARRRLDLELGRASGARNPEGKLPSHTLSASSHLEVAHAVALGAADVGLATRDAALAFGLDFVPLAEERYDLALPREALSDARVARLFDALTSTAFRHELAALGYDTRTAGTRVAEVRA
jgi:molybdate-binding protein